METEKRPCAHCLDAPGTRERFVPGIGECFLLCRTCAEHLKAHGELPDVTGLKRFTTGGNIPARATSDHAFDDWATKSVRADAERHSPDLGERRTLQAMAYRVGD